MSHKKSAKNVTPDPDLARWCALLAENNAPTDTVPPGWLTCAQIAAQTKRPIPTTKHKLRALLDLGKLEVRHFRIRLKTVVRPVPHYRLKK